MLKKSDYTRVMELGEWLEKFLSPELSTSELKALLAEAINLVNLHYHLPENKVLYEEIEKLKIEDVHKSFKNYDGQQNADEKHSALCTVFGAKVNRLDFIAIFSYLSNQEGKWDRIFSKVVNEGYPANIATHIKGIAGSQSRIKEKIIFGEDGIQKVLILFTINPSKKINPIVELPRETGFDPLPIGELSSRIFFDFLFLGGQEYYGFCEQCDKFFLIQRKGRKKFCSDKCRLDHFRTKS